MDPHDRPPGGYVEAVTSELLWPRILRAPALALRPERLGIAFFTLILMAFIGSFASAPTPSNLAGETHDRESFALASLDAATDPFILMLRGVKHLDADQFQAGILKLKEAPLRVYDRYGWFATFVLGVLMLTAAVVGAGAISRSVACEFSQGVLTPWPRALGFSLRRTPSMVGALVTPLVLGGVLYVGLAFAAMILLRWPAINVIGGLGYGLFLLGGVAAALILVGYAVVQHLLVPAVACEGADAIDAIQRGYAYLVARPLRLLLYLLLGAAIVFIAEFLVDWIAGFAIEFTRVASNAGLSGHAESAVRSGTVLSAEGTPEHIGGTWTAARWLVGLWQDIVHVVVGSIVMSVYVAVCTIVYLLIRQVCDGQDHRELWSPEMVGGVLSADEA